MKTILITLLLFAAILAENIFAIPYAQKFDISSSLQIVSPNGGAVYESGSLQEIKWTSSGIVNIKIEYTMDSSNTWNTIISNLTASAESYFWQFPKSVSKYCKIKISDADAPSVYDESDDFFELVNFEEAEPNNSAGTADIITLNETINGAINSLGDIDYYRFTASSGDTLLFTMAGRNNSQLFSYVLVYDSRGYEVEFSNMYYGEPLNLPFIIPANGTYYIRLSNNYGQFPNKPQGELFGIEDKARSKGSHPVNSVQSQTGDYTISLKRFIPGPPAIDFEGFLNSYFNSTQMLVSVNAQGLDTKVTFEYGTSTNYGNAQTVNVKSINFVYAETRLMGLTPNTMYYTRVKAENDSGEVYSSNQTFLTPPRPENWIIKSFGTDMSVINPANAIIDISFPTKDIGFAIQWGTRIVKTTDAGNTWTPTDTVRYFVKLFSIDSNNVYALSAYSILKTTNGGLSWEQCPTSNQQNRNMFFTSLNEGYIIGFSGTILKTTDGGRTWISQNSFTTRTLNDIFFTDVNNGYIVGENGTLLKTSNGGETWNVLASGTTHSLAAIGFADNKHGFIIKTSYKELLETTDGGVTWRNQITNYYFADISFIDRNNGILISLDGNILRTSNSGLTWEAEITGTYNRFVAASKAGKNWAVCGLFGTFLLSELDLVSPSPIEVISPNGSEYLDAGSVAEIKWISSGINNIKIEYTSDSSKSWNTIIPAISANGESYYWRVPNSSSKFCKIRISNAEDITLFDESDQFFSIGKFRETEPNNSTGEANTIALNDTLRGSISTNEDMDYYKFTSGESDTLVISIAEDGNSQFFTYLFLFDSTGMGLDALSFRADKPGVLYFFGYPAGTYFIRVGYSHDDFANKSQNKHHSAVNETRFMKFNPGNSLQGQTGDYIISVKRFIPGVPVIYDIYPFDSYFDQTRMEAFYNPNGLNTKVIFEYGTSTIYGDTASCRDANWVGGLYGQTKLTGLSPNTMYHIRAKAVNGSGEVYSSDYTFLTPDSPENWAIKSIDTLGYLYDISFPTQKTGYAIESGFNILKTTDTGNTWTSFDTWQAFNTYYTFYKLFSIDSSNVIALSDKNIFKTTNGGLSWEKFSTDTVSENTNLVFNDLNTGFIVGRSGAILKTTDGGMNWVKLNSNTTRNLNDVYFTDTDNGYIVGEGGTLLKTTDGGTTWNTRNSSATYTLRKIYFTNDKHGFIITSANGRMLETTDAGDTWSTLNIGSYSLLDMSFADEYNGIAVGYDGALLRTTNSGLSWEEQKPGTFNPLVSVSKTGKNWVVCGYHGTILMSDYNLVSVKTSDVNPIVYGLKQNYPNPFNPATTISYTIPEKNLVELKVFDVLGNEIAVLVNEEQPAGSYELNFNAGNLASGIYLYNLQAGNFSDTKKFILMK